MGEMHDRRVSRPQNRPELNDPARKADQLAVIFAASLNRGAGLKPLPTASRQDRVAESTGMSLSQP